MKFFNWLEEQGIHEPEYMIRQVGKAPKAYEVTKWTRGKGPAEIYRVVDTGKGLQGNCPAAQRRGYCKHIDMVKEWIKKGKKPSMDIKYVKSFLKGAK